jgi:hypothetical protein
MEQRLIFTLRILLPSEQIQIAGYATPKKRGGRICNSDCRISRRSTDFNRRFPIQVVLMCGGMMGAIAVFILFKARK